MNLDQHDINKRIKIILTITLHNDTQDKIVDIRHKKIYNYKL